MYKAGKEHRYDPYLAMPVRLVDAHELKHCVHEICVRPGRIMQGKKQLCVNVVLF